MRIKIKRVYDKPAKTDGERVLIDRLWPRGISKREAKVDEWEKGFAPSNALRRWFHADPEHRFAEFKRRYKAELRKNKRAIAAQASALRKSVTLVTSVKDIEHSHVPTLKAFLEKF